MRKFRDAVYNISIIRCRKKKAAVLNGVALKTDIIPFCPRGTVNEVTYYL